MTNVSSEKVRHALDQTIAAREALEFWMKKIIQQFDYAHQSWDDLQFQEFHKIVNDCVLRIEVSRKQLIVIENSLRKTLETVKAYEQFGKPVGGRSAVSGAVGLTAVVESGMNGRPPIKQDRPFVSASYSAVLDNRFAKATPNAQKVFQLFAEKLCILDSGYLGIAHYSPVEHGVNFNAADDECNQRGPGTTYYHELGHMIDHACMGYRGQISENSVFQHALLEDGNVLIRAYNNSTPQQQQIFIRFLCSGTGHSCSDLANFVTNGQVCGSWGHTAAYCARPGAMQHEAFAHFFEANMGGGIKLQQLRRMFPRTAKVFDRMLEAIINSTQPPNYGQRERDLPEER